MSLLPRKLLKWTAGTFLVLVILLGLGLGVVRILLEQVPDYRVQIQAFISERTGLHIAFSGLDARLRLYGPELVFEDAVVSARRGGQTLVEARRGSVALDIWASLASGQITTGRFWLDAPQLNLVRTVQGRIELVGQDELPERTEPFRFDELPTGSFSISNARVIFRDLATGRGPWTFARVGLTLKRGTRSMSLSGTAELPSALGKQLEFAARSRGPLDDPAALDWDFDVASRDLALASLGDLLPDNWPLPTTGNGSFKLAGVLNGASITSLDGSLSLAGVLLPLPAWTTPSPGAAPLVMRVMDVKTGQVIEGPAPPPVVVAEGAPRIAYDLVRASFDMQRTEDGGWHAVVDGVQLVRPGMRWDPSRIELDVDGPGAGFLSLRGTVQFVSLDGVWPLLAYLPERDDTARLRALNGQGRLRDVSFRYVRQSEDSPPTWSLAGNLDAVAFAPVGRSPGLAGLSGQLVATDQTGRFEVSSRAVEFTLPRLIREPLITDKVNGTITWKRDTDRWRVASDDLVIEDTDGTGRARFEVALPDDGSSPILDLEGTGEGIDATAAPRYVPAGQLTARTVAWFDRAFPAGKVTAATIAYHGPMRQFPFRGDEGTFLARGRLENVSLDYDPRWAPLTQVNGEFEFRNESFEARVTSAQLDGLQVNAGQIGIADLNNTELDIAATATGDLAAALGYLQRSSVGPSLGERFMSLEGRGATALDGRLWLPLKHLVDRKIDVTARLTNAEVGAPDVAQRLTALNGTLQVLNRAVVSPGLQGQFLGGPVSMTLAMEGGDAATPVATVLTANGRLRAAPLKELLGWSEMVKLTGTSPWRMQARFLPLPARRNERGQSADAAGATAAAAMQQSIRIDSDLQGLGIDLPEPLQKPAGTSRPLHIDIDLGGPLLTLRGSLGEVRSVARLQREGSQWTFDRAGIRADGIAAAIPDHAGIRIEGELENLVLDEWLALKGSGSGAAGGRRLRDYLQAANVTIGTFGWLGYEWNDVRGLMQATPAGWQIDVAGPGAAGELLVPYDLAGTVPVTLEMERLVLTPKRKGTRGPTMDPRQVPPIQARINEFELGGRQFGTLRAQIDRVARGLTISNLTAQGTSFTAEITGSWLSEEARPAAARGVMTNVEASLASMDVQSTFKALGYGDVMTGTRGLLRANLNWAGGPDAEALGRASGTVHLEIDDGQLLELQPGAGRVLGLLSVAALPRRLSLDFSDLTDKGLAFDSVRGDFALRLGNAYTDNLLLTGPAADIGIAGRTGLGTRDYDQTAVVTGNIGATLPVAGVLAGGPVVGAAMLLFSQVFKEPLKGITRGYYHITGPWDEPLVERVLASDAKEAAARPSSPVIPTDSPPESSTSP